jgi:hypothetical protein
MKMKKKTLTPMQPVDSQLQVMKGDAYNFECKPYNLSKVSDPFNVELCALVQHLTTIL